MTAARDRLAIAELTSTLTSDFDLPTVLDTVADDACRGFEASSAAVVLLDVRHRADDTGIQVVAEALREPIDADLGFLTTGPGLDSARDGAVAMIDDLTDAEHTRWPGYRHAALRAGMRGVRAFPVMALGASLGALVVHTDDPWGARRPNELGQTLANLTAIALTTAPHAQDRRTHTGDTVETLLQGTVTIATATGIIAEVSAITPVQARLQLHRLARAHGVTVTTHAEAIVNAHNSNPRALVETGVLTRPPGLLPPPHIGS
jgi:GAF domain-containing protein